MSAERAIYDQAAHQKSKPVHLPPLPASARHHIGRGEGAPRENAGTNTPHQLAIYPPEQNCPIDLWLHRCCGTVSGTCDMGNTGIRGASVGSGIMPTMKAAERERRNAQVLQLFLGGASHRTIAKAVGLRSHRSVGNIVQAALGSTTDRRDLLTDEAFAVWQERSERLFCAHWGPALEGNYRSAELCRKILAQHVLVYGLAQEVSLAVTRADVVEIEREPDLDDEGLDVLARMRRDRARAYG